MYFNNNNNFYDMGSVSIRPRHLYWEGDVLVAECFVISGFNTPVSNIRVDSLGFANKSGQIADAAFGTLDGLVLQPYTHALWTFRFAPDVIDQFNADLSYLEYHSDVTFSH